MDDIIKKLLDLYKQATTEKSHYYTANIIQEAICEITLLRIKIEEMRKVING